jgi:hypothetical protein
VPAFSFPPVIMVPTAAAIGCLPFVPGMEPSPPDMAFAADWRIDSRIDSFSNFTDMVLEVGYSILATKGFCLCSVKGDLVGSPGLLIGKKNWHSDLMAVEE